MPKKLNLLDYLIIFTVIFAAVGGYWYLNRQKNAGDDVIVEFTVELRGVNEAFLSIPKIGDALYDSIKGFYIGEIVDMYSKPTTSILWDHETKAFKEAVAFNEFDLFITIRADGVESSSVIKTGEIEMRVGREMSIKSKGYASKGYVLDLRTEKKGA